MWCVYVSCVVSVGVRERWTSTAGGTPSSPRVPWQAGAQPTSVEAELFSSELSLPCVPRCQEERAGLQAALEQRQQEAERRGTAYEEELAGQRDLVRAMKRRVLELIQ